MKILTVFGTRPEIIRLSLIMRLLDSHSKQVLVHTGQNYDPGLSDIFMTELGIRAVDHHLGVRSSGFADQAGKILTGVDALLESERPDRLLILGDTNSGLAAVAAARRGIPVYHLEAGNRCYDNRVPEEVNRRVIDHCSDVLLPYTERSAENLVREGIRRDRIFVTGNPILEVLDHYGPQIGRSDAPPGSDSPPRDISS
jgi:UDP-N-acetylglucosamine 2-epimerase (non-hydrolysing)